MYHGRYSEGGIGFENYLNRNRSGWLTRPHPPLSLLSPSTQRSITDQNTRASVLGVACDMSLHQISLSSPSTSTTMLQQLRPCSAARVTSPAGFMIRGGAGDLCSSNLSTTTTSIATKEEGRRRCGVVRCSLETTAEAVVGQVTEVDKDTFWPIVNASGDKVVVLDMYTEWCGPCKMIAPKLKALSEKDLDVVFLKLDCNKENRPLAKELGLKVVPTFKIFKEGKIVTEVTGAKLDKLIAAIDTAKSS